MTTSEKLQQLGVKIRHPDDCEKQRRLNRVDSKFKTRKHVCAATPDSAGAGSCKGDSGGPLVCWAEGDTRWRIVAVYSRGYDKCSSHGIYMKINKKVKRWILQTVKNVEKTFAEEEGHEDDLKVTWCHTKKDKCRSWNWMERYRELDPTWIKNR